MACSNPTRSRLRPPAASDRWMIWAQDKARPMLVLHQNCREGFGPVDAGEAMIFPITAKVDEEFWRRSVRYG